MQHLQPGHHLAAQQPAALQAQHLYGAPPPQHLAPPALHDPNQQQQQQQQAQQQQQQQHHLPPAAGVLDPDNALHVGVAKLNELRECVDDVSKDAAKFFDKGNKAAGVRARKKLQMLKSLAQDLRVNIQKCKAELAAGGQPPAMGGDEVPMPPAEYGHDIGE